MRIRTLIVSQAALWAVFAILTIFATQPLLSFFGDSSEPLSRAIARILGAELTGFTVVSLVTRRLVYENPYSKMVLGYFICNTTATAVTLDGVLVGTLNSHGWVLVGVYLFYAVAFGALRLRAGANVRPREMP